MLHKLILCLLVVFMDRWTFGEGAIPASVLPDISNLQQDSEAFINRFNIFSLGPQEAVVVTCGEESTTDAVWQNSEYPKIEGGLPGLCTLTLTPPEDTCALRINFDDLAFTPAFSILSALQCSPDAPSFKMSYSGGVTRGLCTDLTNYEGILELDPDNLETTVLLLHLDTTKTFKFRVNVTNIPCGNITLYKSPNICGIKNDVSPASARIDLSSPNMDEEVNYEESERRLDSHRSVKNSIARQDLLVKRKLIADNLRKKQDIFSHALAQSVEDGKVKLSSGTPRVIGEETGIGEWPWMVAIERRSDLQLSLFGIPIPIEELPPCSGVLLDEQHVLTTASCVLSMSPLSSIKVTGLRGLVGEHDLTMSDETLSYNTSISKVSMPLSYDPFLLREDLAILELSTPIDYQKNIRPVCLPVDYNVFKSEEGVVNGWGTGMVDGEFGPFLAPNDVLVATDVKLSNQSACNETLSFFSLALLLSGFDGSAVDLNDYVCVNKGDEDAPVCDGDVGVPLVRRDQTGAYFLEGMSLPMNTCGLQFSNMFTRIRSNSTFLNVALG